jgi:hypothetical protein
MNAQTSINMADLVVSQKRDEKGRLAWKRITVKDQFSNRFVRSPTKMQN